MDLSHDAERFLAGPILSEVDDASRRALARSLTEARAATGTTLIAQAGPNDKLWFLVEGTVAIVRRESGQDKVIAQLASPGIFGATTFFRATPATVAVRATSDVTLLWLDHEAHQRLRGEHPRAAEALAVATVRVLAERFDLLDQRMTEFMASHSDDHPKATEWAGFRARLFEEPNII